jgi:signal peptidase I
VNEDSDMMGSEEIRLEEPLPKNADDQADELKQPREVLIREIAETLLLTLFIFWIVNTATGRFRIEGFSMLPTLEEGEYVIIDKLSYYLDEPDRGDIIVLHFPNDRSRDFIKRVVGVPGDHIEIGGGTVTVNGVDLEEPYINAEPSYSGTWDVPEESYFVLGDNRNNSSDSHNWSFLPRQDIVGKAWIIYWGPDNWGLVPHYEHNLS